MAGPRPRIILAAVMVLAAVAGAAVWAQEQLGSQPSTAAPPASATTPPASTAPPVSASAPGPANRDSTRLASRVSMDQAIRIAEQRFKARVVRAESQQSGDRTVYILRMLNERGRVWTVRVDSTNGVVL